jgi:predicted DCC family thiol-disulfide oxidoreductase YuxK
MKLTIFYDGYCPLCVAEMKQLAELDSRGELVFADIQDNDFVTRYPHIDPVEADRALHAEYEDGRMIYGLDVTHQVWAKVGKKPWLAIIRWPVVRWFADIGYRIFASNRYTISYWFTGQKRCETCAVKIESKIS